MIAVMLIQSCESDPCSEVEFELTYINDTQGDIFIYYEQYECYNKRHTGKVYRVCTTVAAGEEVSTGKINKSEKHNLLRLSLSPGPCGCYCGTTILYEGKVYDGQIVTAIITHDGTDYNIEVL